ncbi:hypothetical protein [Hugenholtzia roseola]|uniref:hypothetical protein n=1 Tax=Hugenholtzia roseola TaxID=1002 RepID=UPI0004062E90|nr:hypothetical protein [Hugenholtzia roseola]
MMEKYLAQLIEDLQAAAHKPLPIPDYKTLHPDHPALEYEGLDYIVAWENTKYSPIVELFGIPHEAFPPPEKLTEAQVEQLVEVIFEFFHQRQVEISTPDTDPPKELIYKALCNYWKEGSFALLPQDKDSWTQVSLCSYNTELCFWGEYCECIGLYDHDLEDFENFKPSDDSQLPF